MASLQKPDILLPITDLQTIQKNDDDDNSSSESSADENLTTKIENANRVPIMIPHKTRKRVTLGTISRKVSCDGWVDINENIIKEQDENNENQKPDYEVSRKNSASAQRQRFGGRRSFSTDGWVELEATDTHQRFALSIFWGFV